MLNRFTTPILFLIFNRPETTARVFSVIRKNRPERLYIAADGPRVGRPEERGVCALTRQMVIEGIDWPCEVTTLFRDENLGCKVAVSSALDWFFSQVEEGIILEDDCLPDLSFFYFCADLLKRYRETEKIFMISGDNFLPNSLRPQSNYYFSRFPHIWGWATWRRAWLKYDVAITDFPDFLKNKTIENIWQDRKVQKYWIDKFTDVYNNISDTWDYQWSYAIWKNNGLSISPNVNLVANIGLGGGSHTFIGYKAVNLSAQQIKFPLIGGVDDIYTRGDDYENKEIFLKYNNLKKLLKILGIFTVSKKFIMGWKNIFTKHS